MGLSLCDRCSADCRHERKPGEIVIQCGAYKPPLTNGDRIRAMSNEELAGFLCGVMTAECCDRLCPRRETCEPGHKGLLEWLKQPAEKCIW